MTFKSILVHVDTTRRCAQRVAYATALAQKHDAHVIGLSVVSSYPLPALAMGEMTASLIESQMQQAVADADEAEKKFGEAMKDSGLNYETRRFEGEIADAVAINARYADVTVVGQAAADEEDMSAADFLAEQIVLAAGRPILVVPYAGKFDTTGSNVLVAWNASREATRAVNDALPILQLADKVTVLSVNPEDTGGHGDIPSADISLHLARHGVKVEASQTVAHDIDAGNAILSRASDVGADLVVMGAYGHSRLREIVLGGVTQTLLSHMTVPVLMSH
jgi:nucleotide-binding universal stress UspA family protein